METFYSDSNMKRMRENNECIDAMLWIGNKPGKYQTVNEFVKEAKLLGCCRQLPFVPGWVKFGKSKVFLAHRDKYKCSHSRGSVFGYFVLHRIEIITDDEVAKNLPKKQKDNSLWPYDVQKYIKLSKNLEKTHTQEEIKRHLFEKLQKDNMPNIAKGKTCKEPPSKEDDEYIIKLIKKILEELFKKSFNWDIVKCFPPDFSRAEGHRMCSLRKGPGSVYCVDALCATIHNNYLKRLKELLYAKSKLEQQQLLNKIQEENKDAWNKWKKYRKDHPKWNIQKLLQFYRGPFKEAVKEIYSIWKLLYPIDPRLNGKARIFGELIVFNKPYPILERAPQAAFRGIWHINGDRLIDQIAKHKGKKSLRLKIYFCGAKEHPETKDELATWLAERLYVSKSCAKLFLDKLAEEACKQLSLNQKFKIPGIGTIRIQGKKVCKIKFFPAKAISQLPKSEHIE